MMASVRRFHWAQKYFILFAIIVKETGKKFVATLKYSKDYLIAFYL